MHGFTTSKALGGALLAVLTALLATADSGAAAGKAGPAQPANGKLDALALARHIDKAIEARASAEKVTLSPRASDAEFLRRVYLDVTGHVPSAEKASAFLASTSPNKRSELIEELLASKDYGKRQADVWQTLMLPRNSDNVRIRRYNVHLVRWLETSFNENKPWDKMVREVLTTSGAVDKNGPVVYYLANGPSVDKITDSVTKLFLGVQLQCAQCHNHPFTSWKQDEYWAMAAFFTKVRPNGNPRAAAKQGTAITIGEGAGVIRNKRFLPESGKILPPKFLQGARPATKAGQPYRPILADWLTTGDNPFFSKAMVNRTWAQYFGRGFVNPIDDMHEGNTPSHPELLADLSKQFAASGFDVKHLIRAICNSDAYQRTSKPAGNNGDAAPELFARVSVKVLTPEQLYDSLTQVLGAPRQAGRPMAKGMARFGPVTPRQVFVNFFQVGEGADPLEYQAGIPQVLRLMNGPAFNNAASLNKLLEGSKGWKESSERLYLATLSRRPTEAELNRIGAHVRKNADAPRKAMADVLWALVNCSEFALNH
jgi:hypothetical protein